MRSRLIYVLAAALTALVTAGAVSAADGVDGGRERAVFVQTNELDGNRIVVFQRHGDGRLTEEDTYRRAATAATSHRAPPRTAWARRARSSTTSGTGCSSPSTPAATPSPSSAFTGRGSS